MYDEIKTNRWINISSVITWCNANDELHFVTQKYHITRLHDIFLKISSINQFFILIKFFLANHNYTWKYDLTVKNNKTCCSNRIIHSW